MARPFFSVVLPVYNARGHIGNAVRDILQQTWRDFELLVVDDGSSDGTTEEVRKFNDSRLRILCLKQNQGLVEALNHGLAAASGHWVARQDADDRCRHDRLEKQAALIQKTPGVVLVYSHARLIDVHGFWRGRLRPSVDDAGLRWDLCFRNPLPHTSAVFPLELARDRLQGYRDCKACEDYDLWSRLLRNGKAIGTSEALVSYRNHAGSIMGREHAVQAERKNPALNEIMSENLKEWVDAADKEIDLILSAWLNPAHTEWDRYFDATTRLAGTRLQPSKSLLAEQDFTLLNRAAAVSTDLAKAMLSALNNVSPSRYASLPQPRTFLTRFMKKI